MEIQRSEIQNTRNHAPLSLRSCATFFDDVIALAKIVHGNTEYRGIFVTVYRLRENLIPPKPSGTWPDISGVARAWVTAICRLIFSPFLSSLITNSTLHPSMTPLTITWWKIADLKMTIHYKICKNDIRFLITRMAADIRRKRLC